MSDCQSDPINVEELMKRCMGEIEFAQEILEDFLLTCERGIENLRQLDRDGLEVKDIERMRSEAHRLKGTCATVAANHLSELFQEVEADIKTGNNRDAANRVPRIESEFKSIRDFVSTGLASALG